MANTSSKIIIFKSAPRIVNFSSKGELIENRVWLISGAQSKFFLKDCLGWSWVVIQPPPYRDRGSNLSSMSWTPPPFFREVRSWGSLEGGKECYKICPSFQNIPCITIFASKNWVYFHEINKHIACHRYKFLLTVLFSAILLPLRWVELFFCLLVTGLFVFVNAA